MLRGARVRDWEWDDRLRLRLIDAQTSIEEDKEVVIGVTRKSKRIVVTIRLSS